MIWLALGLSGFSLGVSLHYLLVHTRRVLPPAPAQEGTIQRLLQYELAPLSLELRHQSEFLRQLQELHPDQSHPHPTSSHRRLFMYRLRCMWTVAKNPDAVAVSRRPPL